MTNDLMERWDEVDPIIKEALEIPDDRRHIYVKRRCGRDVRLLDLVTRILRGDAEWEMRRFSELRRRLIDQCSGENSEDLTESAGKSCRIPEESQD
jgi:hypothetical protein